jgi:iron complex outermembrane receptor protein
MKSVSNIFIVFVCIFFYTGLLSAKEISIAQVDEEFKWLREEAAVVFTEIATKTKMDADLAPGMVTVLQGQDMADRGIRTVYEALSLVPGLHTAINNIGDKHVSVRGIGGSFFSGNLKMMLDGVVLNDTLSTAGYALYEIPAEQLERIEIIRGPGSVIYGEYAYAGVINVVTRKKGTRIFGAYDSDDSLSRGGTLSYEVPEKDLSLALNFSGRKSDGADIEAGEDRLCYGAFGMELSEYSYAPGSTNEAEEDRLANLSLQYKGFSLSGQYLFSGKGDHFGIIHVLPPDEKRIAISHEHQALDARQNFEMPNTELELRMGWRKYVFDTDDILAIPPLTGVSMPDGSSIDITPPEGSLAAPHYEEKEIYGSAEMIWKHGERHTILLGAKYSDIYLKNVWVDTNTSDDYPGQMMRMTGKNSWLDQDAERNIWSIYLQHITGITRDITLTWGLRYDRRHDICDDKDDIAESLTPRISAVCRLADHHILKAQYSEAVRPPCFTELYARGNSLIEGNPDLEAEHIQSYELAYIYRRAKTVGQITVFYSELKDNIAYPQYANTIGSVEIQYKNAGDIIKTRGAELELRQELTNALRWGLNLSFSDTEDEEGCPLEGTADWLGNANLLYQPGQNYVFALDYHYTGKRHRSPDDDRAALVPYDTVDFSLNIFNLFAKGVTLRAGIRNLFDSNVVNPAPVFKEEDGSIGYYYKDDLPRPGREWQIQLSYEF